MAVTSPIKPSDLGAITSGVLACDHLKELLNTRTKMQTFLAWLLQDDTTGLLGADFKSAILQQLLFDAAKKGWIVRANPVSGYLELASNNESVSELLAVNSLRLETLESAGASAGDLLSFDGTSWGAITPIYLAPTTGGSTVPDVTTGGFLSVAHGLAALPKHLRCYLECNSTDVGYAVGDRVDASGLILLRATGGEQMQAITIGADASVVFAVFQVRSGGGGEYRLVNKSTYERDMIDSSKWNVKFYASP